MSVITGEALSIVRDLEDKEAADMCLRVLRELFQDQVKTTTLKDICVYEHMLCYTSNYSILIMPIEGYVYC